MGAGGENRAMSSGDCCVDGDHCRQRSNRLADEAIAALATRPGGVVSRAQLVALGVVGGTAIEYGVKVGRFHDHPIARRRDHARDTDLQLRGYLVTRLTWHEITHEPALVRERVAPAHRSSVAYRLLIRAKISSATACCWSRVGSSTRGQRIASP